MKVYIVVKESSSNNMFTGSSVLGVFADETSAKQCASKAYELYLLAKSKDNTHQENCYITDEFLTIADDDAINLAKNACPKSDKLDHYTEESIYCKGFIEGYEHAVVQHNK
jgi:hypothetical protein